MALNPPRPAPLPLNALRAFESAARLGGFKAAAEELCVTPGAVAQQIKALEAAIGAPLFRRSPQGVTLTRLGAEAATTFTAAFDNLGAATANLRAGATPNAVRIVALPSIAQLWLAPRLPRLRAALPDLSLSVTAAEQPPHMLREPFDLALFYEAATGAASAISLGPDEVFPVCAPSFGARIKRAEDLASVPVLTDAAWAEDWTIWAKAVPNAPAQRPAGPVFSLYSLALSEAMDGAGVLMGHNHLVARLLAEGRLVAPLPDRVELDRHLMLSLAPSAKGEANAARIADLLTTL